MTDAPTTDIIDIVETNFDDCFEYATSEHMLTCDCNADIYDKFKQAAIDLCNEDIDRHIKETGHADFDRAPRLAEAVKNSREEASKYCIQNNIRCSKEKKEISNTIKLFINKYPKSVDDPIFIEVVKSVMNHQLTVHRLKKASSQLGVVLHWEDRNGNDRITVNPLLEAQREFDKIKVDALMILDKKLNGEKSVQVNINTEPIPIEDLYNTNLTSE